MNVPDLPTKKLGSQGLQVSPLGLGCMGMSFAYSGADDERSTQTIHRAIDLGVTLLDTSDMYGPKTNERLVGQAIKDRRGQVQLATKFAFAFDQPDRSVDGRPEYVHQACDASLERLGVDHIDLYYMHRLDPQTPIEDTVGAMAQLVQAGKVRYLGLSEVSPETLGRAHAVHPITAVQSEYSLWSRKPGESILPTCRELGVGFVAYSPLGRGFLTGAITSPDDLAEDDWRRSNPRFMGSNFEKNLELVRVVEELAEQKKATPAQIALAWVLAQGQDIVPIPGTTKPHRVEENAGAVNIELSQDEQQRLKQSFPHDAATGLRYPESAMELVYG